MDTHPWHRIGTGARLGVALIVIVLVALVSACDTNDVVTAHSPDLLEGIGFTGAVTDADVAYLQDGLQFLHDYVSEWYGYIADAKPLMLSVDLAEGARGLAAKSKCCDERGYGLITFGDHFGDWANDDAEQTGSTRRIAFLSMLIHEVTHIGDWRAGRIPAKIDYVSCTQSERAAFTREVEFKRALVSEMPACPALNKLDRVALEMQISAESGALAGNAVNLYCLPVAISGSE